MLVRSGQPPQIATLDRVVPIVRTDDTQSIWTLKSVLHVPLILPLKCSIPMYVVREATSDEVKGLRRESLALKEVVADLTLENRLLKKSVTGSGDDDT